MTPSLLEYQLPKGTVVIPALLFVPRAELTYCRYTGDTCGMNDHLRSS